MKENLIKGIVCLIVSFFSSIAFAQDILVLNSGKEIQSKVVEVNPYLIIYTSWEKQEGTHFSIAKTEVNSIKFANGSVEVLNKVTPVSPGTYSDSKTENISFWD